MRKRETDSLIPANSAPTETMMLLRKIITEARDFSKPARPDQSAQVARSTTPRNIVKQNRIKI